MAAHIEFATGVVSEAVTLTILAHTGQYVAIHAIRIASRYNMKVILYLINSIA